MLWSCSLATTAAKTNLAAYVDRREGNIDSFKALWLLSEGGIELNHLLMVTLSVSISGSAELPARGMAANDTWMYWSNDEQR